MEINTRVAFSVQFLKSIGMSHSYIAQLRGVVKSVSNDIAVVKWDDEVEQRIHVNNLAVVGPNTKFCQC